jgi:hypothetical protein
MIKMAPQKMCFPLMLLLLVAGAPRVHGHPAASSVGEFWVLVSISGALLLLACAVARIWSEVKGVQKDI